jgi:hypothetical protein
MIKVRGPVQQFHQITNNDRRRCESKQVCKSTAETMLRFVDISPTKANDFASTS